MTSQPTHSVWMDNRSPDEWAKEFVVSIEKDRENLFLPRRFTSVDPLTFKDERSQRNWKNKQRKKGQHNGRGGHK